MLHLTRPFLPWFRAHFPLFAAGVAGLALVASALAAKDPRDVTAAVAGAVKEGRLSVAASKKEAPLRP